MIKSQTLLKSADNTGVKSLMCIGILGNNKKVAKIGSLIIAVIKAANPDMNIKKSDIVKAVVVRTKAPFKRSDGTSIYFSENAAVILGNERNPKGTRVFGPILKELKDKNYTKLVSLANNVI